MLTLTLLSLHIYIYGYAAHNLILVDVVTASSSYIVN